MIAYNTLLVYFLFSKKEKERKENHFFLMEMSLMGFRDYVFIFHV